MILLSLLEKDEFDRVNGLEEAKHIWDTLQRAHEGTKPVKKAKRQFIEGQLDRFVMLDDEDSQEMYNRLKKLVNKVSAYGSKRWGDRRVIDRMLRAYAINDTMVISLIQQDPTFKKMTPDDVLDKIINHEMLVEEAQHVNNLSKGITFSKKQDIAFKATKKSKSKKVVEESSSEEEIDDSDDESTEYDPEEVTLFIRRFSKLMGKKSSSKDTRKRSLDRRPKELAIIVVCMVIILLIVPMSVGKKMMIKRKRRRRATRKTSITRRKPMVRHTLARSGTPMMKALTLIVMMWPL
jgi:hypothetical protein